MLPLFLTLLVLSPLASAAPFRVRADVCAAQPAPTTTTTQQAVSHIAQKSHTSRRAHRTHSHITTGSIGQPTTTVTTFQATATSSLDEALPTTSAVSQVTSTSNVSTATSTAISQSTPVATTAVAAPATLSSDNVFASATPYTYQVKATTQCGNDDRLIMPGLPWTVANSMYGAANMVGSQCTNYEQVLKSASGHYLVQFNSITDVELVDATKDICKGYTNVGIGVNLKYPLSDIKSIPAYFSWNRTVESDFRGTNVFDFITAPTKGDGSSTATSEFMLWLKIWGGQVPIGWAQGPVATFDLYGTSWKLYQGVNPGNGVTVRSLLPDVEFENEFVGDLKEWLDAMASKGYIENSQYVNVGNLGTEIFYGKSTQHVVSGLDIVV